MYGIDSPSSSKHKDVASYETDLGQNEGDVKPYKIDFL